MAYRRDIDGMRAVAVAAVVAFHANPALAPGGYTGVDIFFVISGYLISRLIVDGLDAGAFRFRDFYARRLVRLAPALAVMLIVCWAFGWLTLLPPEYSQLGTHAASGAGFLANVVFWSETGYFDTDAASKPLLHLWSLGVEEQFYLVWPLLVALAWWRRVPLLATMLAVAGASFALNVATVQTHPSAAFYLPFGRVWEFALGGALACRVLRPPRSMPPWLPSAASLGALALLAVSVAWLGGRPYPGWWALLPVAWALVTIAAGPSAWVNRVVLAHPILTFIGAISYPLYLWHWPLLTFARTISSGDLAPTVTAALVAASVLLAWLTYRFVEQPVQQVHRAGQARWAPAPLAAALAVVAIAGVSVRVWSRELPPRFPPTVQALVDFEYDYSTAYRERRCYLMPDQPRSAFAPECVDGRGAQGGPLVVLWGDSHAAHLYPGLHQLQRKMRFRVAQFTGSACPPLLAFDVATQPFCRDVNDSVIARIARLRPQFVLLAARWDLYGYSHLDATVAALRRVSRARIVLLGSLPNWTERVPRLLFNEARRQRFAEVPDRLPLGDGHYDRADRALRERATRLGVEFVSAYGILCNSHGCLLRLRGQPGALTTWDDHHLTSAGSAFVVGALAPRLLNRAARRTAQTPGTPLRARDVPGARAAAKGR